VPACYDTGVNVLAPLLLVAVVAHVGLLVHLYRVYAARALARPALPSARLAPSGNLGAPRVQPGEFVVRVQAAISALAVTAVIFMATCFVVIVGTLVVGVVRGS